MTSQLFVVENRARSALRLGLEIRSGGQGTVWRVMGRPGVAAKILHSGGSPLNRAKIEAMIAAPPSLVTVNLGTEDIPIFAWPTHVVENGPGQAVGFLMPEIDGSRAVTLEKYMSRASAVRALSADDRSLSRRMQVCRNLAVAVAELNRCNHFIIDLKPANVLMFKDTSVVCLIDNDSFSIASGQGRFPATAFSSEYLAPEILKGALTPESVINDWQDRFALAVMMFQILNQGIHPFQGTPLIASNDWNNDFCVRNGYYPYGVRPHPASLPMAATVHECWDDRTRAMFDRCFTAQRPSQRTSAQEWTQHFQQMISTQGSFERCSKFRNDVTHLRLAGKPCPECRFEEARAAPARNVHSVPSLPPFVAAVPSPGSVPQPPVPMAFGPSGALPPANPANRKWLYVLLLVAAAILGLAVLGSLNNAARVGSNPVPPVARTPSESPTAPAPVTRANTGATSSGTDGVSDAVQQRASAMSTASDADGLDARGHVFDLAMAEATRNNLDAINAVVRSGLNDNDAATLELAVNTVRDNAFVRHFANWRRFTREARRSNEATLASYRSEPANAVKSQMTALLQDPYDREIAGNFALYLARTGRWELANNIVLYALSLPRPADRPLRLSDLSTLGAILVHKDNAQAARGAYLTALALTNDLSAFCRGLLAQPDLVGGEVKPIIQAVFDRIEARGQSGTEHCANPPQWSANS